MHWKWRCPGHELWAWGRRRALCSPVITTVTAVVVAAGRQARQPAKVSEAEDALDASAICLCAAWQDTMPQGPDSSLRLPFLSGSLLGTPANQPLAPSRHGGCPHRSRSSRRSDPPRRSSS